MKKISTILTLLIFSGIALNAQNYSFLLDGDGEYIQLPANSDLNVGADGFTVEAWIYANEWKSQQWQGSILNTDAPSPDRGYAFRCGAGGKLSFVMSVDGAWTEVVTPAIMNENQWHHVAAVKNTEALILYIDGLETARLPFSGDAPLAGEPARIGASAGFGDRFFDGAIDEIRIWNVARTEQQLADNKTVDLAGTETGLVSYFPFNEGSGTTIGNLAAATNGTGIGTDDSNWIGGYSLPDFDVSIADISGIDKWEMKSRPVKIVTTIQNVGVMAISNVEVNVTVGSNTVSEVITEIIEAGASLDYTLSSPIDLRSEDNPEIEVLISHPDDANSLNNSRSTVITTRNGNRINLFDAVQHNFGGAGQTQTEKVTLPSDLSKFGQILMHISVDCPSTGCDPWDQTGKVVANTSNGSFEIGRYITPYGIACGPWTIDVTDFKSILGGEVNYDSFIQVFGGSGWLVTIDLELIEGTQSFSQVSPVWQTDYHVYGDPGIEDDLDPVSVTLADNSESSHVRLHITGHGQGNTNNAAEFFQVNHNFMVDGLPAEVHTLWKSDCAANSCADQLGNWLFARAGWCPGQEVTPKVFNTSSLLTAGQTVELDYDLQEYTNLLNTGYNSSGHTEPHYRIHGVLVEESATRYKDYKNLEISNVEVGNSGLLLNQLDATITNDGNVSVSNFVLRYYENGQLISESNTISETIIPGASYTHVFDPASELNLGEDYTYFIEVVTDGDENAGDNIGVSEIFSIVSTFDATLLNEFTIQPNPSSEYINIQWSEFLANGQVELYTLDGRKIRQKAINGKTTSFDRLRAGTYLVKVIDASGYTATRKAIVIE